MKNFILKFATTSVFVLPIATVVSCGEENKEKAEKAKDIFQTKIVPIEAENKNVKSIKQSKIGDAIKLPDPIDRHSSVYNEDRFKEYQDDSTNRVSFESESDDLVSVSNEADVNFFYTSAVAPFNNLLRLSMLSNKENHFFVIHRNSRENFEQRVDVEKLQDFYNNGRNLAENKNSTVEVVSGYIANACTAALLKIKKYILEHPDKKINIFGNAMRFHKSGDENKFLDFAGFKNVHIQLLEDGATNTNNYLDQTENMLKTNSWKNKISGISSLMGAPAKIDGIIRTWWSDNRILSLNKYANSKGSDKPYNFFEYKTLSDAIFNTRNKSGSRLSSVWTIVSGLNWENEADKVTLAQKTNGHKSLIILGSYRVPNEEDWIKSIWKKYNNKYNIFYKGHPGHMDHTTFVENWIGKDHPENMFLLEPMISSEELTRDHVIPESGAVEGEKYIQFDKVAVVNHSSAVTVESFPNLDITKDVIDVYDGTTDFVNPSENPNSKNWASQAAWLESLVKAAKAN